jgi:hypothetical protein
MASARIKIFAFLSGVALLSSIDTARAVAPACATMVTANPHAGPGFPSQLPWDWITTGDWNLAQDSIGRLSGTMTTNAGSTCPILENYTVVGQINSAGQFSLTSTYTGSNPGCAPTLTMSGTVSAPGCNTASGTWQNSRGLSGSFTMSHECAQPAGETPSVFQGWDSNPSDFTYQTAAIYGTGPATSSYYTGSYNWGGRTVTEEFLQDADDSCWYSGSPIGKVTRGPNLSVTLDSNKGYSDTVGPSQNTVNTYRKLGRTPCGFNNYQTMVIDCANPTGNPAFAANTLLEYMGNTTISITRAGVNATRFWGVPAPVVIVDTIISTLLLPTTP